ncbi:MAG: hypothetical protein KAJ19_11480, partial [Gammaproteobacteria bacterium]|nr:hypothetical protein [Gammaproteobacteria bacterium]
TPQSAAPAPVVTPEPVEQNNEKSPVPYDRFKAVNDRATAAEALNQKHAEEVQAKADSELDFKTRYEKEVVAHKATKDAGADKDLRMEFVSKSIEAGVEPKIANLLGKASEGLSADNMDDRVKAAKKDYVNPNAKVETAGAPTSPFFNAQPGGQPSTADLKERDLNDEAASQIAKNLNLT